MAQETFYQGSKDVFLAKVRADFDAIEDQALVSHRAYENYSLIGTDPMAKTVFTDINCEGVTVWRHIGTTGLTGQGFRHAGGNYPEANFIRNWETAVYDPDRQDANEIVVPEERGGKEAGQYAEALNRAKKILLKMDRTNMQDPFEVFNLGFTATSSLPYKFFVRGNMGLDGNNTALGERLISTQHARADGGATQSNAVNSSGNARAFDVDSYWAAREQGATLKDDVGEDAPRFGGSVTIMIPPANGLVRSAMEINGSEFEPGNAENQINVQRGLLGRVISSPSLLASKYVSGVTDTNKWFLVDETTRDPEVGVGLVCLSFVPMSTAVEDREATDSVVYKAKQSKVYGFVDWRNILGSKGDGNAYSS